MRLNGRRVLLACLAAMLVALVSVAEARVVAPKSGTYKGKTGRGGTMTIAVAGKSLREVAFQFPCGTVTGATTLQDIKLKKGKTVYRFSIVTFGGVTYSDDNQPDNAKVTIAGAFNRTAKRVTGTLRVNTPRCGDTGRMKWTAKR